MTINWKIVRFTGRYFLGYTVHPQSVLHRWNSPCWTASRQIQLSEMLITDGNRGVGGGREVVKDSELNVASETANSDLHG